MNAIEYAMRKLYIAQKVEPAITKDVVDSVEKSGCKMYGLEHRLKEQNSIASKIIRKSKENNISLEDAFYEIHDVIRYTAVSDTDNFVKNYNKIKKNLENKGYKEIACKNYFQRYDRGKSMHKSVQCIYSSDKNGYRFELQFQTPSSQAAKELKIPIYEERRKQNVSKKRAIELESEMKVLAENVQNPPHINRIKEK